MSNAGQAALTIVGTIAGAIIGGPEGALYGFQAGSLLGNLIFPTKGSSPSLGDNSVATASEGAPIPLLYGTNRLAGTLIYAQPIKTVSSGGGKGGPSQTQNTYYFTGAFLFCETDDNGVAGYLRIWVDKKLVVDFTQVGSTTTTFHPGAFGFLADVVAGKYASGKAWVDQHLTFYTGVESQLPDSTIEADKGAGNVPAFRGLCYAVIKDLDVTSNGARPPLVEIEIVQNGSTGTATVNELYSSQFAPWLTGDDPRNCLNDHEYNGGVGWRSTLTDALADIGLASAHYAGWSNNDYVLAPYETVTPGERRGLTLWFTRYVPSQSYGAIEANPHYVYCGQFNAAIPPVPLYKDFFWTGTTISGDTVTRSIPATYIVVPAGITYTAPDGYGGGNNCIDSPPSYDEPIISGGSTVHKCPAVPIYVRRKPSAPANPCTPRCGDPYPLFPGSDGGFCVIDGAVVANVPPILVGTAQTITTSSLQGTAAYRWLSDYYDGDVAYDHPDSINSYGGSEPVLNYPIGPVLAIGDPLDTPEFWNTAWDAAVSGGAVLDNSRTYASGDNISVAHFPVTKGYAYSRSPEKDSLTPVDPTVGEICAAICKRAGIDSSLYDFSAFTKTVHGYAPARLSSAREMLVQPLQAQFGDITESNGQLVGVVRGGTAVLTLTTDDLRAVEAGQQTPPAVTITRRQPIELPRVLRVHYLDDSNDYQAGQQIGIREYGPPRSPVDLQLAIAMSPDDAAVIADVALNEAYAEREQYQFSVPATDAFLALKPADPISLPVEGKTVLARLLTVNYAFPGLIAFTAARSDAGVYSSSATAITSPPAGTQDLVVLGPTTIKLLDCAALTDAGNDAGAYVGVVPTITTDWPGARLSETVDGTNYTDDGAAASAAAVGTISNALGSASQFTWDCYNSLTFKLTTGAAPASTTDLDVYNGANMAVLGAAGRWEVIQYRDVTVNGDGSYTISHLLRGRRGTEQAIGTSQAGDTIVLVDSALLRVSETADAIGVARTLVATTVGTAVADAPTTSYTPTGAALKPYAPCRLGGGRDASGNITLKWTRRTRLAGELRDGVDVSLGEQTEQYLIEILNRSAVIRTITVTGANSITYSAADQIADFGATQSSLSFTVAQISATYGPGFTATGTV